MKSRINVFVYSKAPKKPIANKFYVVPPPYNKYKVKYLGKGKWKIYSSRGKLEPHVNERGYKEVKLRDAKGKITFSTHLHTIIYAVKVGNWNFKQIRPRLTIDHKDRDPSNDRFKNLRCISDKEQHRNRDDSYITSSYDFIYKVFKMRAKGMNNKQIAKETGFTYHAIIDIFRVGRNSKLDIIGQLPKKLLVAANYSL